MTTLKERPNLKAKVSIIIPCYNHEEYVGEAIESALSQTVECEVIVVDDGSTDNSQDVIGRFPVQRLQQKNLGTPAARNTGISTAKGQLVLPLDADDKISSDYLQKALETLAENPDIAVVYPYIRFFGDEDFIQEMPEFDPERLKCGNFIPYCSLFKREVWEKYPYQNEAWGYEDWDFWLGAIENGYKAKLLPEALFHYRKHGRSQIDKAIERQEDLIRVIVSNHPKLAMDPDKIVRG